MRLALPFAAIGVLAALAYHPVDESSEKKAVERVLPLLQSSARTWTNEAACTSCHHQSLGSVTIAVAREKGFAVNDQEAAHQVQAVVDHRSSAILNMYAGRGAIGSFGFAYALFGFGAENRPADELTDAMVHHLMLTQGGDGGWIAVSHRQPLEDARETITALAIRGMKLYGGSKTTKSVVRGREWLIKRKPAHHEGRAMRLLGLAWSGASPKFQKSASDALFRTQLSDGSWEQLPGLGSDPYATGQAVVALRLSGTSKDDDRIKRAIRYLLSSQAADGSWHTISRRKSGGLPYFESGFPYGLDQFISYAGTTWATISLAMDDDDKLPIALTRTSIPEGAPHERKYADDEKVNRLFIAIAHGRPEEVKKAIADGADVNGKNLANSTPLHWAVFDEKKAEILLDAGALPNTADGAGRTAVHAAAYYGSVRTIEMLVKRGGLIEPPAGFASPMAEASEKFDGAKIDFFLKHGGELNPTKRGKEPPLAHAIWIGDNIAAKRLLAAGADPNPATHDAVLGLDEPMLKLLLSYKADPNALDEFGKTPLHYAAMKYAGHDRFARLLLEAGADVTPRDKDGKTALQLAREHKNGPVEKLLMGDTKTSG